MLSQSLLNQLFAVSTGRWAERQCRLQKESPIERAFDSGQVHEIGRRAVANCAKTGENLRRFEA
jgi:hypothetical protein